MNENVKMKPNSWGIAIIIGLFYALFLMIFIRPMFARNNSKLMVPEEITYYDAFEGNYVLLKDEVLFNSSKVTGNLNFDEGTRLRFGEIKAGRANNSEYFNINARITELHELLSMYNSEISDVEAELRRSILNEKYLRVNNLIGSYDYNYINDKGKPDKEEAEKELAELNVKLLSLSSEMTWNPPGIISYLTDGFENYNTDSLYTMKTEDFDKIIESSSDAVDTNDFKIIDNFKAVITVFAPDNERIKELHGKYVNFSLDDYNTFITGKLVVPPSYDKEGLIGIEINSNIEDMYQTRKGYIDLIFESYPALKIPTSALVNYEGKQGVCVKDINGIIQFRPILLYKDEGGFVYISKGDDAYRIGIGEEMERTVSFYEEVITSPNTDNIGKIY